MNETEDIDIEIAAEIFVKEFNNSVTEVIIFL
jgi:hypothetical protein